MAAVNALPELIGRLRAALDLADHYDRAADQMAPGSGPATVRRLTAKRIRAAVGGARSIADWLDQP